MIIDAHQHFWQFNEAEYGWIDEKQGILKQDYLPEDLYKKLHKAGFDGSIAVQARQSIEETRWLLKLAKSNEFIRGVVGWVDLCSAGIRAQLAEFAGNTKLVGVRHVVQDEPNDDFILQKEFLNGIAALKEFGLCYD